MVDLTCYAIKYKTRNYSIVRDRKISDVQLQERKKKSVCRETFRSLETESGDKC